MIQYPPLEIRKKLSQTGLSRKEIADMMEVSIHTINKWATTGSIPEKQAARLFMLNMFVHNEGIAGESDSDDWSTQSLKRVSERELVSELERRGWKVTLETKS
jgi:transcriptional regulator with XRE-family HTH domain